MIHPKSGAGSFRGSLKKTFATSVFALSALAGSVVLSGGDAKALSCQFDANLPNPFPSIYNCQYGATATPPIVVGPKGYYEQWYETNKDTGLPKPNHLEYYPTDKDIWFVSGPSSGAGDIEWKWVDVSGNGDWLIPPDSHSIDEWHVDVDFNPNFSPVLPLPLIPQTSVFDYVVIIDKGQGGSPHNQWNDWFEDVRLGATFGPAIDPTNPARSFVTKDIYEAICTSATPGGIFDSCVKGAFIDTLTVTAGGPGTDFVQLWPTYNLDKLYIVDTAVANNDTIDAYQNVYRQVPGPLPILGAGAAFGFSRKLRSRIKASSAA
jgi:hypothetical protein